MKTDSKIAVQRGFTLIELLVVVTIIAILMGIAIPSYTEYVAKAKRAEAAARLVQIAQMLERYYSDNGTYNTTLPPLFNFAPGTTIYSSASNVASSAYTIGLTGATATAFTLVATPNSWTDSKCGPLTLANTGVKGTRSDGTTNDSPAKAGCW